MIAVNYRSDFVRATPLIGILSVIDLDGNTTFVDFSPSYALTDRFNISLKGTHLTDERQQLFVVSVRRDTFYDSHFGRTFTFGVSYRY